LTWAFAESKIGHKYNLEIQNKIIPKSILIDVGRAVLKRVFLKLGKHPLETLARAVIRWDQVGFDAHRECLKQKR
jgi:hypothetical protein